jgi:hypothetical protein
MVKPTLKQIRDTCYRMYKKGELGRVKKINPDNGKMEWAYYLIKPENN